MQILNKKKQFTLALTSVLIMAVQVQAGNIENTISDMSEAIVFQQDTNELMRVHGNGKVGIGTSNPIFNLHLYGSEDNASQYLMLEQSTRRGSFFIFGENGIASYPNYQGFNMYSNDFINLRSDASNGIRIFLNGQSNNGYQHAKFKSSGTLMLGTYDEVASVTVGNRNGVLVGPSTASGGAGNYQGGGLQLKGGASSGNADGGVVSIWTSTAGVSGDNLNSQTEKLRVDSDGNVGIGLTNPSEKLDIAGDIKATGLAGAGTAFACIDSVGKLYRSPTACN